MAGILNSYIRNPRNKSTNLAKTVSLLIFGEEKLAFRPMWVIWLWAVFPLKISMIAKLWRLRHQNSNSALAAPSRPVDPSSRVTRLGNLWRMWSSSDRSPIRTIYDFLNKPMIYMCKRVTVVSKSCKMHEIQWENAFNTSRPQTFMRHDLAIILL